MISGKTISTGSKASRSAGIKLPRGLKPAPGKIGVSISAYAKYRGCGTGDVYRALQMGKIQRLGDGSIDPIGADLEWRKNTRSLSSTMDRRGERKRAKAAAKVAAAAVEEDTDGPTVATDPDEGAPDQEELAGQGEVNEYTAARIKAVTVKTARDELNLKRELGEVIDRNVVIGRTFKLARTFRDTLVNWPARVAAEMAAELECDPRKMLTVLEQQVRNILDDISRTAIDVVGKEEK